MLSCSSSSAKEALIPGCLFLSLLNVYLDGLCIDVTLVHVTTLDEKDLSYTSKIKFFCDYIYVLILLSGNCRHTFILQILQ